MKIMTIKLILPIIFSMPLSLFAATLIETDDPDGASKVWVDGSNMRMQMDETGQYMLINAARNKMYIIVPAKREMIDASEFVQQSKKNTQGLNIKIDYVGKGPVIAGYKTKKYNLSVNGKACEQSLISKQALIDARMGDMMDKMSAINFNPMGDQFMSDCDRADSLFVGRMKKLGMPLGTVELDGRLRGKVKRITMNANAPKGGFKVPKGYRRVSMQQKMQESFGANMPNDTKMTPEMKRMMEEMQRQ